MGVALAIGIGIIIFSLRDAVVKLYDLSPSGVNNVRWLLLMMACTLWIRMFNFSVFIGALRAGGDTRFALIMEICSIWLIGVPAAYTGAFVFHLPVYWVYLMVILEEVAKAFVSGWRFRSRRWIHDLVNA
jgi:Na+-driven multidrug efflux pump